jgi:hypothetical protein
MPPATGTAGTRAVTVRPAAAWTPALHGYFAAHFTLIALPSSYLGAGNVPRGGLYIRKSLITGAEP